MLIFNNLIGEMRAQQTDNHDPATDFPIEVYLNGGREYIQGTQMVAQACALASTRFEPTASFLQASFTRITSKQISASTVLRDGSAKPVGRADFGTSSGRQSFHFYEGALQAERRSLPEQCVYNILERGKLLEGSFSFCNVSTVDDLLTVVVQTIKFLHEQLSQDVRDIWFTGIRSFDIPLKKEAIPATGQLAIIPLNIGRRVSTQHSIVKAEIRGTDGSLYDPTVTFAFRSSVGGNLVN